MADELTVGFGAGDGEAVFQTWDAIESFISKERATWEWLNPSIPQVDVNSIATVVRNTFNEIAQSIVNQRQAGAQPASLSGILNNAYHPTSGILRRSDGFEGGIIRDAREVGGEEAGAFAYALLVKRASLSQMTTIGHLRGAILAAVPSISEAGDIAARLAAERANYRSSQRSGIERLEKALRETDQTSAIQLQRFRDLAAKLLLQRRRAWKKQQASWTKDALAAVADIRTTEDHFKTQMGLQAPVEYWRAKAREHGTAEASARARLMWFFPASLLILGGAFAVAAWRLLDTKLISIPPAAYVIISAGLVSVAALVFWVGRLLTKLYLSEHHLKHDAEERAVMTTTYLALTVQQAADAGDRQIILNALFRPTSDGIVKDDGPTDMSLAGVLSRLGVK